MYAIHKYLIKKYKKNSKAIYMKKYEKDNKTFIEIMEYFIYTYEEIVKQYIYMKKREKTIKYYRNN